MKSLPAIPVIAFVLACLIWGPMGDGFFFWLLRGEPHPVPLSPAEGLVRIIGAAGPVLAAMVLAALVNRLFDSEGLGIGLGADRSSPPGGPSRWLAGIRSLASSFARRPVILAVVLVYLLAVGTFAFSRDPVWLLAGIATFILVALIIQLSRTGEMAKRENRLVLFFVPIALVMCLKGAYDSAQIAIAEQDADARIIMTDGQKTKDARILSYLDYGVLWRDVERRETVLTRWKEIAEIRLIEPESRQAILFFIEDRQPDEVPDDESR